MARKESRRSKYSRLKRRAAGMALAAVLTIVLPLHALANEVAVYATSSDEKDIAETVVNSDTGYGVRVDADNGYEAVVVTGDVTVDDSAFEHNTTAVEAHTGNTSESFANIRTGDVTVSSANYASTAVYVQTDAESMGVQMETGEISSSGVYAEGVVTENSGEVADVVAGNITASGKSEATGIKSDNKGGDSSVHSDAISVKTTDTTVYGYAYGVYLIGNDGTTTARTGEITSSSTGEAYGAKLHSDDGKTEVQTKGDITASGDSSVTGVELNSNDSNGNDTVNFSTAIVTGDVTSTSTGSNATGVQVFTGNEGEASCFVMTDSGTGNGGNVTVSAASNAYGISINTFDDGKAGTSVDGNVKAEATSDLAVGVYTDVATGRANAIVNGDVTADGPWAHGVDTRAKDGTSNITVEGDVTVQASEIGNGVLIDTSDTGSGTALSENHISEGDGTISVTSTGSSDSSAAGVSVYTDGGEAKVYTGNVKANGQGSATGLDGNSGGAGGLITVVASGKVSASSSEGGSTGIDADSSAGKTSVKSGDVSASGNSSVGVDAFASDSGSTAVETANITSNGVTYAKGISAGTTSTDAKVDVLVHGDVDASASGTTGGTNAYGIDAHSMGTETITVDGSVTATNATSGPGTTAGVYAETDEGSLDIRVAGAITAEGSQNTTGVSAQSDDSGSTTVKVGAGVTASGTRDTFGIDITGIDGTTQIDINGDVSAETTVSTGYGAATGINLDTTGSTVNVNVGGNVTGTLSGDGFGSAYGIRSNATDASLQNVKIDGNVDANGKIGYAVRVGANNASTEIQIGGSVTGTYDDFGLGVNAEASNGGSVDVQVKDGIALNAPAGSAIYTYIDDAGSSIAVSTEKELVSSDYGIEIYQQDGAFSGKDSHIDIQVAQNVVAENYGIMVYGGSGEHVQKNVVISETLSSKKSAVAFADGTAADTMDLTVWKIETEAESLTEQRSNEHYDSEVGDYVYDTKPAEDFEKNNIFYIIKLEQPETGGVLSVDGTTEKNGFATAKEGETVLIKVSLDPGYRVTNAYNGLTEKVSLVQNEAGEYFIEVPKGGGVYLSVVLDNSIAPAPSAASQYWFQVDAVETVPAAVEAPAISQEAPAANTATAPAATPAAAPASPALAEVTPAQTASCAIVGAESCLTQAEVALLGTLPEKEQLLVVLHKAGYDGLIPELDFGYGPNTLLVSDAIQSNIAPVISTETLEVDGMTATWNVIRVRMNGTVFRFIFWDNVTSWAHGWQN